MRHFAGIPSFTQFAEINSLAINSRTSIESDGWFKTYNINVLPNQSIAYASAGTDLPLNSKTWIKRGLRNYYIWKYVLEAFTMEKRLFPEKQIMSYVNPKWSVWILNSYYIFYFFTYFQNHIFLGRKPAKKKDEKECNYWFWNMNRPSSKYFGIFKVLCSYFKQIISFRLLNAFKNLAFGSVWLTFFSHMQLFRKN